MIYTVFEYLTEVCFADVVVTPLLNERLFGHGRSYVSAAEVALCSAGHVSRINSSMLKVFTPATTIVSEIK